MNVVSPQQMSYIENLAYKDGVLEETFMENAGKAIADAIEAFVNKHALKKNATLLLGKGNNSGDAYVAGFYLYKKGFTVNAYQLIPIEECSPLCQKNHNRFCKKVSKPILVEKIPQVEFQKETVIIDGLFGTGFRGSAREPYASLIRKANQSGQPILSIDIPSGLNGDTGVVEGDAIVATETLFLGLPKTGFFLLEGWNHVGKIRYIDFGLDEAYKKQAQPDMLLLTHKELRHLLPTIKPTRHKYDAGVVVGLAGSPGMPGAAMLAAEGALKGGAGLVRLLHPKGMEGELSKSPYELIKVPYTYDDHKSVITHMNKADATFLGPGIGRSKEMISLLKNVIPKLEKPCIVDADALTLLAQEDIPFPSKPLLTPHLGEMRRLLGKKENIPQGIEFLTLCREFATKQRATLILKGGPSFIFSGEERDIVSPYGHPGMATAGSGDVLTGLLAALAAQGLSLHDAACLGCALHGRAGEYAAAALTPYCMTASDILKYFPMAFKDYLIDTTKFD